MQCFDVDFVLSRVELKERSYIVKRYLFNL